jgi:hypothetical protein
VNPLEAAALIAAMVLPAFWLVRHELDKLDDPAYLREHGVVIVAENVLQTRSRPIGEYMGQPIWASVTFLGMVYRFDRVARPQEKEKTGPGELYLDPGLVYVAI